MKLLQDLTNEMVKGGIGIEMDTDVFPYVKPKSPDNIISLTEYKGSQVAQFTNTNVRSIQITVRNIRNMDAQTKIWKIYDLLHTDDNIIKIGNKICILSLRHTPMSIGVDEKGRYEWILNVGITYNNTREE